MKTVGSTMAFLLFDYTVPVPKKRPAKQEIYETISSSVPPVAESRFNWA